MFCRFLFLISVHRQYFLIIIFKVYLQQTDLNQSAGVGVVLWGLRGSLESNISPQELQSEFNLLSHLQTATAHRVQFIEDYSENV